MYLCDKHKLTNWYPTSLQERARVNEYSHWQHFNIRANGAMVFRTKVNIDRISSLTCNRVDLGSDHYPTTDE